MTAHKEGAPAPAKFDAASIKIEQQIVRLAGPIDLAATGRRHFAPRPVAVFMQRFSVSERRPERQHRSPDTRKDGKRPANGRRWGRETGGWPAAFTLMLLLAGLFLWSQQRQPPRQRGSPPASPSERQAPPLSPPSEATAPEEAEGSSDRPEALLEQSRPFAALWRLGETAGPDGPSAARRALAARSLTRAGLIPRARAMLRGRLARVPGDLEARLALAEAALAAARPREALAVLGAVDEAVRDSGPAQLCLGDAYAALEARNRATDAYRRAEQLEPAAAVSHVRLGRLALAQHDWNAARQEFTAATHREPDEPEALFGLGQALWGAGEHTAAAQLWAKLAAKAPGYAPARLALGRACARRRQWAAAVRELSAATTAERTLAAAQRELAGVMAAMGRPASALYQRGLFYLQTDRPDRALDCYHRMAALNPRSPAALLMASFCWMQMKQYLPAAAEAARGLQTHPQDPALRARVAMLYLMRGNRRAAADLAREWVSEAATAAEPHRLLGRVAFEEARYGEAVREYEQAITREPADPDYRLEMGRALLASGTPANLGRAEGCFRQALERAPGRADLHLSLGLALQRQGRHEAAREELLQALDLDPSQVAAASALVRAAAALRRPALVRLFSDLTRDLQARERERDPLWRAVGQHPRDPAAHERLARLLVDAGDLRSAGYQLEQVAELAPSRGEARSQLAVVRRLLALEGE